MSESWKNRLWSLLLVCTFAVVLSVCDKAINSTSDDSSIPGYAFADGSTVTITSLALPTVSHMLVCNGYQINESGVNYFFECDATDDTSLVTKTVNSNTWT